MPEPCRLRLTAFQPEAERKFSCTAGLKTAGDLLVLEYCIEGPLADIRIPQEAVLPGFTLGLWQHTCCECFLRRDGGPGYTEWNFALDCNWWCCRFDGYRQPAKTQPDNPRPRDLQIVLRENLLMVTAAVACPDTDGLRAGPAIIIEHATGGRSHWAVAHSAARPDFHSTHTCVPLG